MENIKKISKFILGFIAFFILIVLTYLMAIDPYFFKIDNCLDDGGCWNYETKQCQYVEVCEPLI